MTVAAVLLVKDEADIIEFTLRHLAANVDEILVSDNASTDGTRAILDALADELPILVFDDPEVGYWQSRKTTHLANLARERGHDWVIPCDADELWYQPEQRIGDWLAALPRGVDFARAELYDHITTGRDTHDRNPFRRIGHRFRSPARLGKVACRLDPSLVIEQGNHVATVNRAVPYTIPGLIVRHFSWRTPEQYVRKMRNGYAAYAATDLAEEIGGHWRMFGPEISDATIAAWYSKWFTRPNGATDDDLIYDPAPYAGDLG